MRYPRFDEAVPAALGIIVRRPVLNEGGDWDFDGSSRVDGLYNQMLRYLVETAVYELLPEVLGRSDYTWRGFFPTRLRPKAQGIAFTSAELSDRKTYWGLDTGPRQMLTTYGPASFRTLVEEIVRNRQQFGGAGATKWCGTVGVGLNSARERPRTIHDLADWYAFMVGGNRTGPLVGPLLAGEFRQKLSISAQKVLLAGAYASRGDRGRALVECFAATEAGATTANDLTRSTLRRALDRLLPFLTGEDVAQVIRIREEGKVQHPEHLQPVASALNKKPGRAPAGTVGPHGQQISAPPAPSPSPTPKPSSSVNEKREDGAAMLKPRVDPAVQNAYGATKPKSQEAPREVEAVLRKGDGFRKEFSPTTSCCLLSGFNPDWDAARVVREVENAVAAARRRPFLERIEVAEEGDQRNLSCRVFGGHHLMQWLDRTVKQQDEYLVSWSVARFD